MSYSYDDSDSDYLAYKGRVSVDHDDIDKLKDIIERSDPGKLDGIKEKLGGKDKDDKRTKKVDVDIDIQAKNNRITKKNIDVDVHGVPKRNVDVDIDINKRSGGKKKVDIDIDIDLHRPSKKIRDIYKHIDIDVPDYWPYLYWPYPYPYTWYVTHHIQPVQEIYESPVANSLVTKPTNMTIVMIGAGLFLVVLMMMFLGRGGGGGGGNSGGR